MAVERRSEGRGRALRRAGRGARARLWQHGSARRARRGAARGARAREAGVTALRKEPGARAAGGTSRPRG